MRLPKSVREQSVVTNEGRLPVWLTQLSGPERKTLTATFCGWMVDGFDVMIYSFVLPSLMLLWHLTKGQAGLLGTSTLVLSSVGGWLAGLAADRWGRVAVLQGTIAWFALFTFLSGLTHSFPQLLITRGLQGLGFGGEWAVGSVLMSEVVRAEFRGRAVGVVQSGWSVGWALAAACYSLCFLLLPGDLAWRILFFLGILPALLVLYIRRHVAEPHREQDVFRDKAIVGAGVLRIFAPELLRTTAFASVVAMGAQGGYYAITTWLPLYLTTARGLSVLHTSAYMTVVIGGSFAGYLVAAHLTDVVGRRATLILFAVCSLAAVGCYTLLSLGNASALLLGFPLGFFSSGTFSPLGSFFAELFPAQVRGSAQGFSYNFGRAIAALFPALVGFLSARISLAHAIGLFSATAYAMMVLGVLFLPETKGRQLQSLE